MPEFLIAVAGIGAIFSRLLYALQVPSNRVYFAPNAASWHYVSCVFWVAVASLYIATRLLRRVSLRLSNAMACFPFLFAAISLLDLVIGKYPLPSSWRPWLTQSTVFLC